MSAAQRLRRQRQQRRMRRLRGLSREDLAGELADLLTRRMATEHNKFNEAGERHLFDVVHEMERRGGPDAEKARDWLREQARADAADELG